MVTGSVGRVFPQIAYLTIVINFTPPDKATTLLKILTLSSADPQTILYLIYPI